MAGVRSLVRFLPPKQALVQLIQVFDVKYFTQKFLFALRFKRETFLENPYPSKYYVSRLMTSSVTFAVRDTECLHFTFNRLERISHLRLTSNMQTYMIYFNRVSIPSPKSTCDLHRACVNSFTKTKTQSLRINKMMTFWCRLIIYYNL